MCVSKSFSHIKYQDEDGRLLVILISLRRIYVFLFTEMQFKEYESSYEFDIFMYKLSLSRNLRNNKTMFFMAKVSLNFSSCQRRCLKRAIVRNCFYSKWNFVLNSIIFLDVNCISGRSKCQLLYTN